MRHHLDRPIDVENSYESFKARYRPGQSLSAQFDNTRCTAKTVSGYNPRVFVADVIEDEFAGDSANPNPPSRALGSIK